MIHGQLELERFTERLCEWTQTIEDHRTRLPFLPESRRSRHEVLVSSLEARRDEIARRLDLLRAQVARIVRDAGQEGTTGAGGRAELREVSRELDHLGFDLEILWSEMEVPVRAGEAQPG